MDSNSQYASRSAFAGIIENMGPHVDSVSGQKIAFFGEGCGQRMADWLQVPFPGSVPLDPRAREGGDAGKPESAAGVALKAIAPQAAARISVLNLED